jgi:prepilin-type N-terminal cleavage/methylation domain-containing protein
MNRLVRAVRARMRQDDSGFTLVEMLVAMAIFAVLVAMTTPILLTTSRSVDTSKSLNDANEEARLALNRMSRELRQASEITGATVFTTGPYATAGYVSGLTFGVDFNGDGTIEPNAVDAEVLTYRYVASPTGNGQIELVANDPSGVQVVRPILAAHVSDFHIEIRSSLWQCDTNGNGITTWQELDSNVAPCPSPDNNNVLDANELRQADSVVIAFTVFEGTHQQTYRAQIDLRNVGL